MVELAKWIIFSSISALPTTTIMAILKPLLTGSQTFLDYVIGGIVRV